MYVSAVKLPRLGGMVPLRLLFWSPLRMQPESVLSWGLSISAICAAEAGAAQRSAGTHRVWIAVKVPSLDGIVPLNVLIQRPLRVQSACTGWVPRAQSGDGAGATHAQPSQSGETAQTVWDGSIQLILANVPARHTESCHVDGRGQGKEAHRKNTQYSQRRQAAQTIRDGSNHLISAKAPARKPVQCRVTWMWTGVAGAGKRIAGTHR
jgi:hypothetical protein